MSGLNGDKARFHKDRRKKIARRLRKHEILGRPTEGKKTVASSEAKPKAVTA
jgi:hypothetical protein